MKRFRLIFLAALLLGLVLTPLSAEQKVDAVSSATKEWAAPPQGFDYEVCIVMGIDHFIINYNDKLYQGGNVSLKGAKRLKHFGVETFFTISGDDEQMKYAREAGLTVVNFPYGHSYLPAKDLEAFIKMMKSQKGGVYLHSDLQNSKALVLGAAYRMYVESWTLDKALIEFGRLGGSLKDDHRMLKSIMHRAPSKKK